MAQQSSSSETARHVLACLHEVRLDRVKGNPSEWQNACHERQTGGQATWLAHGGTWNCQRPPTPTSASAGSSAAGRRLLQRPTAATPVAQGATDAAHLAATLVADSAKVNFHGADLR